MLVETRKVMKIAEKQRFSEYVRDNKVYMAVDCCRLVCLYLQSKVISSSME